MEFQKGQKVMFFCEDHIPGKWEQGEIIQELDRSYRIEYQGRTLAALKHDVVRFEPTTKEQVENFGKQHLNSLVSCLEKIIETLNINNFCGKLTVDVNECIVNLMNGEITIQPGITLAKGIGVFREFPCWTITGWHQIPSSRDQPEDVLDFPLGKSINNLQAAKIAVEKTFKYHLESMTEIMSYQTVSDQEF